MLSMHKKCIYGLITWNLLPQRKNMNHRKHVIPEKVFTSTNLLPKYLRNRSWIINKVKYIVYKEWLGRALMNEINGNNFDMNVLWKRNIACLWYWIPILFRWLQTTLILVDHETGCVGKLIFLAFHSCEEHPDQSLYMSCALIWRQGCPKLRIGNRHGM
jgi:hypothetical protein